MKLENFKINSLHGIHSFNISIKNNKLILVGENGSGKTTLINMLFCFLSRQWGKLFSYNFESISVTLNGNELELKKDEIQKNTKFRKLLQKLEETGKIHPQKLNSFQNFLFSENPKEVINNPRLLWQLSEELQISQRSLFEIFFESEEFSLTENKLPKLKEIEIILKEQIKGQILYLPTYRRIEQELRKILPWMEDVDKKIEYSNKSFSSRSKSTSYIELVEFGMIDIDRQINESMSELKNSFTGNLKNLMGSYLSEIISGKYNEVKIESLSTLNAEAVELMLGRIDDNLLSPAEKERLRSIINKREPDNSFQTDQKILTHFMLKLLKLHASQQRKEKDIRQFVNLCNEYLVGKRFVFDSDQYQVIIELLDEKTDTLKGNSSQGDLPLRLLSSGEKQIVSLFSHLLLSGVQNFFVLIDEPELSLSVPWQKNFLPNILETKKCNGLIAVTHSPFIFENDLDQNAHLIDEFWTK